LSKSQRLKLIHEIYPYLSYNTLMQKIINFFKEVKAEFKQISWPKRESIIQSTIVVISISVIVSLILGGFDYLFINGMALMGQKNSPQTQVITPSPAPPINPLLQPTISK